MSASLITTENTTLLGESYSLLSPKLSKIEFGGTISVFSFIFETESSLSDNWEFITSLVAAYYQSEFEKEETEFERWNIYILFLVKESVSIQLKYKIENDKFSSRKIVQDKITQNLNEDLIHQLIDKYIINDDLDCSILANSETVNQNSSYSNDSKIYALIENNNLMTPSKATNKDGIEGLYQQIIKEVEDEIQKS